MDFAHLHLILNHIPIVGFPFLVVMVIWAQIHKDNALRKFVYVLSLSLTLATAAAFQTGALAVVAFFSVGKPSIDKIAATLHIVTLVLTIGMLSWTGFQGGKIRHGDGIVSSNSPTSIPLNP